MTRTPPTLDQLREKGHKLLAGARQQLLETNQVLPVVVLGDSFDGMPDMIIAVRGDFDNSAKNHFADLIKAKIDEHGFSYSVFMSDTWFIELSDSSQFKTVSRLQEQGIGLQQIAAMGLGTLKEQVTLCIEAVDKEDITMGQSYTRDAQGKPVLFGDVAELPPHRRGGRFKFFGDRGGGENDEKSVTSF